MSDELTMPDVVSALRAVPKTDALWSLVTLYYKQHGVEQVSYHLYRGYGTSHDAQAGSGVTVYAHGFPDDWVCAYIGQRMYRVDPISELARTASSPFFWTEVDRLTRISPEQSGYLAQMAEAGVGEGLAMHVYGPSMRNAYVGLGFGHERPELSAAQITEFQCVDQMGHLRYCEITRDDQVRGFDLSPREREILDWIARGKSNAVIASILGVSPHTVDTLVRRLFDKLAVTDRTSAALKGVGSGLILPH